MSYYYSFYENTFIPWDLLYPECRKLLEGYPKAFTAMCFRNDLCPSNKGCVDVIAKRVKYWFDVLEPKTKSLNSYFKVNSSVGVLMFSREMEPTLQLPCNRAGFKKVQDESVVKSVVLAPEYWNIHSLYSAPAVVPAYTGDLIQPRKLIR